PSKKRNGCMTTPPKAAKFRIRAGASAPRSPGPAPLPDDGFGDEPFPTAETDMLGPAARTAEDEIEAIRAEGLTGRPLRTARRVAMKHGIEAASALDAIRPLRKNGSDPSRPAGVLHPSERPADPTRAQWPRPVMPPKLPGPPLDEAGRAREIIA